MHLEKNIDWSEFLKRNDLLWNSLPDKWEESAFLGNGLLGATVFKTSDNEITWSLGRTDVTEHREDDTPLYGKRRLPIGDMSLVTVGKIIGGDMRLDLYNAEARATIKTDKGEIILRTFVHTDEMLLLVELETIGDEIGCSWRFKERLTTCPERIYSDKPEGEPNPKPIRKRIDLIDVVVQPLFVGGEYATAWPDMEISSNKRCLYLSIGSTYLVLGGEANAVASVKKGVEVGLKRLFITHAQWWHDFYKKSFISIPDAQLESLYWIQIYKLACATRSDRPAIDLMGPWFKDSPWLIIWWNLNIQLTYWPVYASNHLELGESLCRLLDRNMGNLILNVPSVYRDDSAAIGRTSSYDCLHNDLVGEETSSLPFVCHNYWLQYRYSMDKDMLKDRFYPLLKKTINFYMHLVTEGDDGKLHLPFAISPEYDVKAKDCNVDLALLRWGLLTLIEICDILKIDDVLLSKWNTVLDNLVDYPLDENGLMVGTDVPFDQSHRHFSHIFAIYPLYLLNWDDKNSRELIEKSFYNWESRKEFFEGYSYTAASSICASMEKGDEAVKYLKTFVDFRIEPNTLYLEHGPCIETPLSAAKAILDMLLQSWGNKIRIFPGVPTAWEDISFYDLRAEGGFLVSAQKRSGQISFVSIKSLSGEKCRVVTGLNTPVKITVNGKSKVIAHQDVLELELLKDEEVIITPINYSGDFCITPVNVDEQDCNLFGSKLKNMRY
jgi:hypothetical protein